MKKVGICILPPGTGDRRIRYFPCPTKRRPKPRGGVESAVLKQHSQRFRTARGSFPPPASRFWPSLLGACPLSCARVTSHWSAGGTPWLILRAVRARGRCCPRTRPRTSDELPARARATSALHAHERRAPCSARATSALHAHERRAPCSARATSSLPAHEPMRPVSLQWKVTAPGPARRRNSAIHT